MADTSVFAALRGHKYANLTTFKRNGAGVPTPVWFAEDSGKIYVMTRSDSWKMKRLRHNPHAKLAPSTIRGKTVGAAVPVVGRLLGDEESVAALAALRRKYFLMRFPRLWSKKNIYLEFTAADDNG